MTAIELFLSPGNEGGQTLQDGLSQDSLSHTGAKESAKAVQFPDPGGDPNSLADQGWGVVVPKTDEGDRLLELVKPLIDKRNEDCGRDVSIYRVKPDMDASKTITWRDRRFVGNEYQEDIPWYLLILGQPDQVSLEFQQVMSNNSLVGRLAFDRDEHYQAYIDKLLAWEKKTPGQELARTVFFTAVDGTAATTLGSELLMRPTVQDARQLREKGSFPVSDIIELEGEAEEAGDRLLETGAEGPPSILFSCSHGMGAPRSGWSSSDRQHALQGALCLGRGEHIAGDSLIEQPFLPGGMWFFFACFGAGTPGHSAYHHWLSRLKKHGEFGDQLDSVLASLPDEGERPFIAALPKAVLANPNGPLAVLGHLDLAWSYSFQDLDKFRGKERHRRFQGSLRDLARGSRVGIALRSLLETRAQVQTELTVAADAAARAHEGGEEAPDDDTRLGHRWMLHQDVDGYVLLGDPAARLSIDPHAIKAARRRKRAARARPESTPEISTAPPSAEPAAGANDIDAIDLDTMEEAVHAMLAGEESPKALAKKYSVDRKVLRQWEEIYTEAGRAALQRLRDGIN
ncbi:MAG: hypothetical protein MJE77_09450 [Proteobacteria bacterium]|nr:hypothetical protein [Pseudomonadota bacterium]